MFIFLNFVGGESAVDPSITIIITVSLVVFVLFAWLRPRPIDTIYNHSKEIIFKIFSKRGSFVVHDYTGNRSVLKVYFRTYIDVEAYVSRKKNGWDQLV